MNAPFDTVAQLRFMGRAARAAAAELRLATAERRASAISAMANALRASERAVLDANAEDMEAGRQKGLSSAMLDRLKLDRDRIHSIAQSLESIAALPDPIGQELESWTRPNGLALSKVTVPIGVIGMIYESRPNVTADAGALCVKSGNAVILRSGSEALRSSRAIHAALAAGLRAAGLPETAIQLVPVNDRTAVGEMLAGAEGGIDLIIPRGGKGLVERVQREARVPVLAHLDGLNTTYIHATANADMAEALLVNAKMRRTGVCGATETALIDRAAAAAMVPRLVASLAEAGCEVRGDAAIRELADVAPATEADFATEHLAPVLTMAVVEDIDAALAHIARHGSGHTDAIVTEDVGAAERFLCEVDSAIVMHNASTQFADGGEFGFGAEIGISTGRMHARGPVGAQHLVTHKYRVRGEGTIRP